MALITGGLLSNGIGYVNTLGSYTVANTSNQYLYLQMQQQHAQQAAVAQLAATAPPIEEFAWLRRRVSEVLFQAGA